MTEHSGVLSPMCVTRQLRLALMEKIEVHMYQPVSTLLWVDLMMNQK